MFICLFILRSIRTSKLFETVYSNKLKKILREKYECIFNSNFLFVFLILNKTYI